MNKPQILADLQFLFPKWNPTAIREIKDVLDNTALEIYTNDGSKIYIQSAKNSCGLVISSDITGNISNPRVNTDILWIAMYHIQSKLQWGTPQSQQPQLSKTEWPKDIIQRCFSAALLTRVNFELMDFWFKLGADPSVYPVSYGDPDKWNQPVPPKNKEGQTSFFWACQYLRLDTFNKLKEFGVWHVDKVADGGITPVHMMLNPFFPREVKFADAINIFQQVVLDPKFTNINLQTGEDKITHLHYLATTKAWREDAKVEFAKVLLKKNPDLTIKNVRGKTAVDVAVMNRLEDLAELLEEYKPETPAAIPDTTAAATSLDAKPATSSDYKDATIAALRNEVNLLKEIIFEIHGEHIPKATGRLNLLVHKLQKM